MACGGVTHGDLDACEQPAGKAAGAGQSNRTELVSIVRTDPFTALAGGDGGDVEVARGEVTQPMGTWTHASNLLAPPPEPMNQTELNLCQQ